MTIQTRNYYLEQILIAEGGTPVPNSTRDQLLIDIVVAAGGVVTDAHNRNALLNDYLVAIGGARIAVSRNEILEAIVTQLGETHGVNDTRNELLLLWSTGRWLLR